MNKLTTYFTNDFRHWSKIDFFKRSLYLFLFINTLTLLPAVDDLFGYNGLAGFRSFRWHGTESFFNLLSHPINHNQYWIHWFFVSGQLFFLVTGFLRIQPLLSSISIWFLTVNLFIKGGMFFTGGEVLVNLLLFYLIFIQEPKNGSRYVLQNVLNNVFYVILLFQICILYFFSFYWKLYDPNWLNGNALYYVSKIDTFSSKGLKWILEDNLILGKILTYTVLFYQGSFAILVWVKHLKVPLLILGVIFHLSISVGMGIFAFGVIMSISYLLFLDDSQLKWIKTRLKKS
jgi:hypothetical protein